MNIPPFSIFSAVSEILVTVVVLYALVGNLRGGPFRWKLLGLALAFELCVNVMYMIHRAGAAERDPALSGALGALFAIHGMMSLVMFVGLLLVYLTCTFESKDGRRTWLQRHPAQSWTFIALWMIAVISGEAAFIWRYLLPAAA